MIDAKNFKDWPNDLPFSERAVIKQAEKQIAAVKGSAVNIEWRVATPDKADLVRSILKTNNLPIRVTVEPPKGP